MGIRIHKVLGWGLKDVKYDTKSWRMTDTRFSAGMRGEDMWDFIDGKDTDFLKWLKGNQETAAKWAFEGNCEWEQRMMASYQYDVRFTIEYLEKTTLVSRTSYFFQPEFGLKNVFMFTPPGVTDYSRYDDIIDYYEDETQGTKLKDLTNRCGIYPNQQMICFNPEALTRFQTANNVDLEKLDTTSARELRHMAPSTYNQIVGRWTKGAKGWGTPELQKFLKANYRPAIASSVMVYTRYLEIFVDWQKTIQQFRPMLYTYWS